MNLTDNTETLEGVLRQVRFRNPDNGYAVLAVEESGAPKNKRTWLMVVGNFPELKEGETLVFQGSWTTHPTYGRQFKAISFEAIVPEEGDALADFLGSGLFPGVGESTAKKILLHFGKDTLRVLDEEPSRLFAIKGFSKKKSAQFQKAWQEHRQSREALVFLTSLGMAAPSALKLYRRFGTSTVEQVRENPYILGEELYGIGFEKADAIARQLGIGSDAYVRLKAGLLHALHRANHSDGHVFLPQDELLRRAARILKVGEDDETAARLVYSLDGLFSEGKLVRESTRCYTPALYKCEEEIGAWVRGTLARKPDTKAEELEEQIRILEAETGIHYSEEQHACIAAASSKPIYVLTGGPGTGKTTTLKGILHLLWRRQKRVLLAAPTGRAARRMAELCHTEARTIHRLLEIDSTTGQFQRNQERPLEADWLIVDEVSMVDVSLMRALVNALPARCNLLLIGDRDQLPSIGPGMVLAELLSSQQIPSGRLTRIFRQGPGSAIAEGAYRVLRGLPPRVNPAGGLEIICGPDPDLLAQQLTQAVAQDLQARNATPFEAMQVLVPMHRPPLGTQNLNRLIQLAVNPKGAETNVNGLLLRLGDRVMQLRNNYDWNIFNGDVGRVLHIDPGERKVTIEFETGKVTVPYSDMDQVGLAYACTVHKSQGSEYPTVAVVLDASHAPMLQRNLFYTALTRAKTRAILFTAPGAIEQAAATDRVTRRYTRLSEVIRAGSEFMAWMEE